MGKKRQKRPLPKLFIGSSTEALAIVKACCKVFSRRADCVPWTKAPQFSAHGSFPTFTALCHAAQQYDFALFVLTPDDLLTHRGVNHTAPRDNVVFEMGLFIGAIGPERVFGIVQEVTTPSMKIASDLLGVNMPRFRYAQRNPQLSLDSIKAHVEGFAKSISDRGFRDFRLELAKQWGFFPKTRHFEVCLGAGKIAMSKLAIGKMHIALAARVEDTCVNFEDDGSVVYSAPRALPSASEDMIFKIAETEFRKELAKGIRIQGHVILVPAGVRLAKFSILREATAHGCKAVDSFAAIIR